MFLDPFLADIAEPVEHAVFFNQRTRQKDQIAHGQDLQMMRFAPRKFSLDPAEKFLPPLFRFSGHRSGEDRVPIDRQYGGLEQGIYLAVVPHRSDFRRIVERALIPRLPGIVMNHIQNKHNGVSFLSLRVRHAELCSRILTGQLFAAAIVMNDISTEPGGRLQGSLASSRYSVREKLMITPVLFPVFAIDQVFTEWRGSPLK